MIAVTRIRIMVAVSTMMSINHYMITPRHAPDVECSPDSQSSTALFRPGGFLLTGLTRTSDFSNAYALWTALSKCLCALVGWWGQWLTEKSMGRCHSCRCSIFPKHVTALCGSSLYGGWGTWRGGELLLVPSEELGSKPAILHLLQMLLTCRGQNSHYQSLDSLANTAEAGHLLDLFWCFPTKRFWNNLVLGFCDYELHFDHSAIWLSLANGAKFTCFVKFCFISCALVTSPWFFFIKKWFTLLLINQTADGCCSQGSPLFLYQIKIGFVIFPFYSPICKEQGLLTPKGGSITN